MKKTIATSLLLLAAFASVFAQKTLKKGDLVYGTLTDSDGPLAGFVVTQRNGLDRIMAQTTTDENGNFSFRVVNPQDRIIIYHIGYQTIDVSINNEHLELNMKKQDPLPGVRILDGPDYYLKGMYAGEVLSLDIEPYDPTPNEALIPQFEWETISYETLRKRYYMGELNTLPQKGLYIQSAENSTYCSIDEFYDNWLLPIKSMY